MKFSPSAVAGLLLGPLTLAAFGTGIGVAAQNIVIKIDGSDVEIDPATQTSFDSFQDQNVLRPLVVSADGRSITVQGNAHRAIPFPSTPITITKSTQLDFDFHLADLEEVQAICISEDLLHASAGSRCFMAANAQSINWRKLNPQTAVGETRHYKIPLGKYYTGSAFKYLVLMQDNDSANRNTGSCTFSNIEIRENPNLKVKVRGVDVTLDTGSEVSFTSGQDEIDHPLAVSSDGLSVRLEGNIHRAVPFPSPVVINRNTNLDFDYTLMDRTEVHTICLTESKSSNSNCLVVANDDTWGNWNLKPKTQVGETRHYTVPVGLLFPTDVSNSAGVEYLAWMQDNDSSQRWTGNGTFANIEISDVQRPQLMIKVDGTDRAIDTATQVAFDPTQDTPMHYLDVNPDGNDPSSVRLSGNVHRAVEYPSPLVVTRATELDFDFTLHDMEEAHAICVVNGPLSHSSAMTNCFMVGGTQNIGYARPEVGDEMTAADLGVTRHYKARIGLRIDPGEYQYLVFMQDNDSSDRSTGSSTFSNIAFSERPSLNVNVKGTVTPLLNYQRSYNPSNQNQDTPSNLMVVSDDGASATMNGNLHKALAFTSPVTVDDDTVLGFRLHVDEITEVSSLCLDEDLVSDHGARCFKFAGTQEALIYRGIEQTFEGDERSYLLHLGDFFTGEMNYLGFIHDNDVGDKTGGISTFSDIKIYQVQPSCLKDHAFSFTFSECTVANFVAEVEALIADTATYGCPVGRDIHEELLSFFDASSSYQVAERIGDICKSAYVSSTLPFNDLLEKEDQFVAEFFDGGGKWNYEVDETDGPNLSEDAARIQVVSDSLDSNRAISWPDVHNFHGCELRAAMCCHVASRASGSVDNEPTPDNSDACYMDFSTARQSSHVRDGYSVYYDGPDGNVGGDEGPLHCRGFAWGDDSGYADAALKGNTLFHVAMKSGLLNSENVEELPGAPLCGCLEHMPVVTKAACTKTTAVQTVTVSYDPTSKFVAGVDITSIVHEDCGVDLAAHYGDLVTQEKASAREKALLDVRLVGEGQCGAAIASFLDSKGFTFGLSLVLVPSSCFFMEMKHVNVREMALSFKHQILF